MLRISCDLGKRTSSSASAQCPDTNNVAKGFELSFTCFAANPEWSYVPLVRESTAANED